MTEKVMKTIGLLGGMSWESTRTYYETLNTLVKERLGGLTSAEIILHSVNFGQLEAWMRTGNWDAIQARLHEEALKVQASGAEGLALCTNTMHKVMPAVEADLSIPFFHIADALGEKLVEDGVTQVGLLGTRFTMIEDFYASRLQDRFGIATLIPTEADIQVVDDIIFDELVLGVVRDESRQQYVEVINRLADAGAGGIALACTEIEMLIKPGDVSLPVFDTTALHCAQVADWAMTTQ